MMAGRKWSPGECSALVVLARAGDSSAEIADRMGRTRGAVLKKAEALGVRIAGGCWRVDPFKRADLLDHLAAHPGCTLSDAARALNRSVRCVRAMAALLARDGLLVRTGGATLSCRYVVSKGWAVREG